MRQSFEKLCQKYIDVVLDKDGMYSVIDSVCDQPIFFLISQAEDFPDINRQKFVDAVSGLAGSAKEVTAKVETLSVSESTSDNESQNKNSAFTFSDFKSLTPDLGEESETVSGNEIMKSYVLNFSFYCLNHSSILEVSKIDLEKRVRVILQSVCISAIIFRV